MLPKYVEDIIADKEKMKAMRKAAREAIASSDEEMEAEED